MSFSDKLRAKAVQAQMKRDMNKKLREERRKRAALAKKNWGPKKPRKKKK